MPLRNLLLAVAMAVLASGLAATTAHAQGYALRFFGGGVLAPDADRVKIRIDDETLPADPGPPVDVGAGDFAIEFWLRGNAADNTAPPIACGPNYDWIFGNIVVDRDRFNQGRTYGISLVGGVVAFGVQNEFAQSYTVCGGSAVLDGAWHHIAVERRFSDGQLWVYVDGVVDASAVGPTGDISYPDDGVPGNFCGGPCNFSDPFIVLGAEKHDAGAEFPSFSGFFDELRFSDALRYAGVAFARPTAAFVPDASTVGLYSFDEGPAGPCGGAVLDTSGAAGGPTPGECRLGGTPAGPLYSEVTPFGGVAVPAVGVDGLLLLAASGVALAASAMRGRAGIVDPGASRFRHTDPTRDRL